MPWLAVVGAALMASVAPPPAPARRVIHPQPILTLTASACTASVFGGQGDALIGRLLNIAPPHFPVAFPAAFT